MVSPFFVRNWENHSWQGSWPGRALYIKRKDGIKQDGWKISKILEFAADDNS